MATDDMTVVDLEILSDALVGREGGFLAIRRVGLRNVRSDGTRSLPYVCDFLARPMGIDAVVVAIYARSGGTVRVLLRDGLRPPLHLGRAAAPVSDDRTRLFSRELVAGIVERDDRGEAGLLRRAVLEVEEESGLIVRPDQMVVLGAGVFPSPGAMPERFHLYAVEVDPAAEHERRPMRGDGSPMEEGARLVWMELGAAIRACVTGELEDAKTELGLRRLAELLG
ncbi:MAG: NUDIX hydrolase [Myxococcales bacterium]|nr:NUDIX hydrolase [Myxococcales bacterium]